MPRYRVSGTHAEYLRRSNRSRQLLSGYRSAKTATGRPIPVRDVEEVASLCLLRLSLSWESFLEDTFLRYMCGAPSLQGNVPTVLAGSANDLASAFATLAGRSRYINWSAQQTTGRAARQFLIGDPFHIPLAAVTAVMNEMQAVRNRMAHHSEYSKQEFDSAVRNHLGYIPRGITPGRFIQMQTPLTNGLTLFDHFRSNIDAAATAIANF